jgi:hypothetical protein
METLKNIGITIGQGSQQIVDSPKNIDVIGTTKEQLGRLEQIIEPTHWFGETLSGLVSTFSFSQSKSSDLLNINLQTSLFFFSLITFFILFFIPAYYGRYSNRKRFLMFSDQFAWIFQESPCVYISLYYLWDFIRSPSFAWNAFNIFRIFLVLLFTVHYVHRSLIYPLKMKMGKAKRTFPIEISLMAFTFCVVNSVLQCRSILYFSDYEEKSEQQFSKFLTRNCIRLLYGIGLFALGMWLNISHDYHLIQLRNKKEDQGYVIPEYFLFKYISCPNYFGEILEWIGFALMANTLSAWIFIFSSFSNLYPRALTHHKWYKNKFENYPKDRKAIVPLVI